MPGSPIGVIFRRRRACVLRQAHLAFLAGAFLLFAAADDGASNPGKLLADADALALLNNWPKAASLFAQAETLFAESADRRNVLQARLGYLWATADTGTNASADSELNRDLLDPLVQRDPKLMLRCLVAKAARERVVNEASARTRWESILNLAKASGDDRWRARAQAELGEIAYLDGEIQAAVEMLKQAMIAQLLQRDIGATVYYTSVVGNGLIEAGQPENGLAYCNRAIEAASTIPAAGFPFLAYQGKARALIALRRKPEAAAVLQQALARAHAEGNRFAEVQLLIVAGTGAEEHAKAIEYLKAANDLSELAGFHHAFAWSALELAKVYRDSGDPSAAEKYVSRGLAAMRSLEDKYHLPQHVALLADLKARQGKANEASRLYEQATDMIDALLISAPSRQIESSLISTLSSVYLGRFELATASARDTQKAYSVIEAARGRSLADALRGERNSEPLTDPAIIWARKQINQIQSQLLKEANRAKRQELLARLFESEQVLTPIGRTTPFRAAVVRSNPAPLATIQSRLRPDEAILEYVLDEPNSSCIVVTRNSASIITLPAGRHRLEQTIDAYVDEIRAKRSATEVGQQLYSMLLQPVFVQVDKPRLTVVPDGPLNFLPFDSLSDPGGHRVLESHILSYCPSGTILYLLRSPDVPRHSGLRFLGVGDVPYTSAVRKSPADADSTRGTVSLNFEELRADRLGDIPNTRDEIMAASRAIAGQSKLLLGGDATETAIKSQPLETFDIIHIATHGVPSPEFPDRAALVLAPDPQGREDGLLQAREIRNLPLRAQLVTLSGCDAGVGSLEGEEGVTNLIRAFLFAGSKAVVASLWMTSDIFTAQLMERFYSYLAMGEDPSSALRQAKIDLIKRFGPNAVPFYWGGFVTVGDGSHTVVAVELAAREATSSHSPAQRSPVP
jgi:CHAT domain-containing protein